ncbi:hypothetical protein LOTGIDRAFT_160093 [Lottia gigantea]|uniref:Uncharacterized protein n=1 Tax=Lottia gigantea TaxID=225164 RepID=V3ZX55_LOTGI|nr:hypothetical protein LOTGIDRAFT_160093 [Lottia gigantea]ESO96108.1 hypothetical protein LOTGIDRAFT_160093 [Lottia gigantea]
MATSNDAMWSQEKEEELVILWESKPNLYDISKPEYGSAAVVSMALPRFSYSPIALFFFAFDVKPKEFRVQLPLSASFWTPPFCDHVTKSPLRMRNLIRWQIIDTNIRPVCPLRRPNGFGGELFGRSTSELNSPSVSAALSNQTTR